MSAEENPAYVLDASVILKWVLDSDDEPGRSEAANLLERWKRGEIELFVPSLWIYEVGNILALKKPDDKSASLLALLDLGLREIALDRRSRRALPSWLKAMALPSTTPPTSLSPNREAEF